MLCRGPTELNLSLVQAAGLLTDVGLLCRRPREPIRESGANTRFIFGMHHREESQLALDDHLRNAGHCVCNVSKEPALLVAVEQGEECARLTEIVVPRRWS